MNHRKWLSSIFLIALSLRILLFIGIRLNNPKGFLTNTDSIQYWQIAENILNHSSFSLSNTQPITPDHSRTPFYPLFISLLKWLGLDVAGIIFIQILVSAATCLMVILLTYKLVGSWKPAYLAGAIVAVDIPSIVYANSLLTETVFTFLLTLSILFFVLHFKEPEKISPLLISGALMGLSILCRPISAFLPLFIVLLFFIFSKRPKIYLLKRASLYLTLCFVVVSPWLVRNQFVFGTPILTTMGYNNILHYRAAGVYAVKQGIPLSESQDLLGKKVKSEFQGDKELEPIKYKKFEAEIGTSIILESLPTYIRNHIRSIFNMLFKPLRSTIDLQLGLSEKGTSLMTWGEKNSSSPMSGLLRSTSGLTIALVFLQLISIVLLWLSVIYGLIISFVKKEQLISSIILLLILYFCIMSGGPEAYARFRVPLIPFLAIAAGVGMIEAFERLKRNRLSQ
ncbi:glycosyltransferase family 39 protein [candidate division KSB1 bacterium]|nr:glycosyltransferase family 39 protein [candidate division KSB1 bacterium]